MLTESLTWDVSENGGATEASDLSVLVIPSLPPAQHLQEVSSMTGKAQTEVKPLVVRGRRWVWKQRWGLYKFLGRTCAEDKAQVLGSHSCIRSCLKIGQ